MAAVRSTTGRAIVWALVVLVIILAAGAVGLIISVFSAGQFESLVSSTGSVDELKGGYGSDSVQAGEAEMPVAADSSVSEESAAQDVGANRSDSMVILTAGLDLRVDSVDDTLPKVRSTASAHGAEITELYVQGGEDPQILGEVDSSYVSPASASVTLRVPSGELNALTEDLSELGDVQSQSASAQDVTEQHIDLEARLKNLKAEEARLRSFFERTDKVTELLQVESELSRVRGEIEAMQAQIDYLERQVARATLVLTISEPGPVVRPDSGSWGFVDAITRGIQGAAAVVRVLITGLIALTPMALLAVLLWLVVRAVRHRRNRHEPTSASVAPAEPASDEDPSRVAASDASPLDADDA